MNEHRQEFDNDLEAIEGKVIELFAMVAEGVPVATRALLNGDNEAYLTLAERDRAIDALYVEVEGLANREILLQAPVAADLRFLLSVLRIVPELERSTTWWSTSPPAPVTSSTTTSPRAPRA